MTPAFFCGKHLLDLDHGLLRDTTFSYHSAGVGFYARMTKLNRLTFDKHSTFERPQGQADARHCAVPGPVLRSRKHWPGIPSSRRRLEGPARTARRCASALHVLPRFPISRCSVMTMRPGLPIAILPGVVTELGRVA